MHVIYNLSLYNVYLYFNACCYWLKSLGIHCLHYALFLFVLETNLKIKHLVPNYSHTYKAEDKTSLLIKRYNITQLCILYIIVSLLSCHATLLALHDETNNSCEGDNNKFTLSFFNLTTLKTMWYPKLRYNIIIINFTTVPTPWSFYIGRHFTSSMERLFLSICN